MAKVKKRSGDMQEFDRAKLKRSLKKAGAKEEHATKVAETVAGTLREGMTTAEIKRMAATELRRMDQRAAQTYETFRKPMK
ncbi:MAG: ATP cone domain-containing protein [Candidatus Bathyarchaeota archaeon]|nr:ATP cone domain-containing protein [Candidatus Bathyarchaeota archaeon]